MLIFNCEPFPGLIESVVIVNDDNSCDDAKHNNILNVIITNEKKVDMVEITVRWRSLVCEFHCNFRKNDDFRFTIFVGCQLESGYFFQLQMNIDIFMNFMEDTG